jgi:hypothetical protein
MNKRTSQREILGNTYVIICKYCLSTNAAKIFQKRLEIMPIRNWEYRQD